ncbi:uncharacterized protein [Argopecten irradians]
MLVNGRLAQPSQKEEPCCVDGVMEWDLDGRFVSPLPIKGVEVIEDSGDSTEGKRKEKEQCNRQIVFKANFEKSTCGCQLPPDCGRKMLRIDMKISNFRNGYLFNMGDSISNNAWGGDSNHQENDAEFFGINNSFFLFKGDKCLSNSTWATTYPNILTAGLPDQVTVFISNEHIRFRTNFGVLDEEVCHRCLYALGGQSDSSIDGVNEDVYVSFNRVILNSVRDGFGVCEAAVQWVCPFEYDY